MEEGKLAKWHVKEGDTVKTGDILAEIETDKATMEFEAIDEGRVGKLLVPEGAEAVKVNTPIALLLGEGESADSALSGDIPSAMRAIREALVPDAVPSRPPPKENTGPVASAEGGIAKRKGGSCLRRRVRLLLERLSPEPPPPHHPMAYASLPRRWRGVSRKFRQSSFRRFKARVRADASSKPMSKRPQSQPLPPCGGGCPKGGWGVNLRHQALPSSPPLSRCASVLQGGRL